MIEGYSGGHQQRGGGGMGALHGPRGGDPRRDPSPIYNPAMNVRDPGLGRGSDHVSVLAGGIDYRREGAEGESRERQRAPSPMYDPRVPQGGANDPRIPQGGANDTRVPQGGANDPRAQGTRRDPEDINRLGGRAPSPMFDPRGTTSDPRGLPSDTRPPLMSAPLDPRVSADPRSATDPRVEADLRLAANKHLLDPRTSRDGPGFGPWPNTAGPHEAAQHGSAQHGSVPSMEAPVLNPRDPRNRAAAVRAPLISVLPPQLADAQGVDAPHPSRPHFLPPPQDQWSGGWPQQAPQHHDGYYNHSNNQAYQSERMSYSTQGWQACPSASLPTQWSGDMSSDHWDPYTGQPFPPENVYRTRGGASNVDARNRPQFDPYSAGSSYTHPQHQTGGAGVGYTNNNESAVVGKERTNPTPLRGESGSFNGRGGLGGGMPSTMVGGREAPPPAVEPVRSRDPRLAGRGGGSVNADGGNGASPSI